MARFMDLPPEVRIMVYHLLLVDPLRDEDRISFTLTDDGKPCWNRISCFTLPDEPPATDIPLSPMPSSVNHIDFGDLLCLARCNRLLCREAKPLMYAHADLTYTVGESLLSSGLSKDASAFLSMFLQKLSPSTCGMFEHLTVIDGLDTLTAGDMRSIVDLVNGRLSGLSFFELRSPDPNVEIWITGEAPAFCKNFLRTLSAARPVAHLIAKPTVSIIPRATFYFELYEDGPDIDAEIFMILALLEIMAKIIFVPALTEMTRWHFEAKSTHNMACERGDYLRLTLRLRSTPDMYEEDIEEGMEEEELSDLEHVDKTRQRVLDKIQQPKHDRSFLESCILRLMMCGFGASV